MLLAADPGFPVGGHFSVETYVETKELDPVGGSATGFALKYRL